MHIFGCCCSIPIKVYIRTTTKLPILQFDGCIVEFSTRADGVNLIHIYCQLALGLFYSTTKKIVNFHFISSKKKFNSVFRILYCCYYWKKYICDLKMEKKKSRIETMKCWSSFLLLLLLWWLVFYCKSSFNTTRRRSIRYIVFFCCCKGWERI